MALAALVLVKAEWTEGSVEAITAVAVAIAIKVRSSYYVLMRKEQLRNGVSIPALLGVGIVLGSISLLEAQKHSPVEWSVNDVARVKATEPTFHVDEEIGLSTATTLISLDDGQFLYGGYKGWWKPQ